MLVFFSFIINDIGAVLGVAIFKCALQPGQTFSFIARNVKGQKLNNQSNVSVSGAEAIGVSGSALNLNTIQFDGE